MTTDTGRVRYCAPDYAFTRRGIRRAALADAAAGIDVTPIPPGTLPAVPPALTPAEWVAELAAAAEEKAADDRATAAWARRDQLDAAEATQAAMYAETSAALLAAIDRGTGGTVHLLTPAGPACHPAPGPPLAVDADPDATSCPRCRAHLLAVAVVAAVAAGDLDEAEQIDRTRRAVLATVPDDAGAHADHLDDEHGTGHEPGELPASCPLCAEDADDPFGLFPYGARTPADTVARLAEIAEEAATETADGRCDTCGTPCDPEGCRRDRSHAAALDVEHADDECPSPTCTERHA